MIRGLYAALATPLTAGLTVDFASLVKHANALLEEGVDGVAILATTGEGPSLSISERVNVIDAIAEAGITGDRLIVATGAGSLEDTATLSREAIAAGAAAALVVPPYYFKNVPPDGVVRFYGELAERVADDRFRVLAHHIPQVSCVPIDGHSLERLRAAYPGTFAGIHDSSGDWHATETWCAKARGQDLAVTTNLETRAIELVALGGAGCISGTLNATSALARRVLDARTSDTALALQSRLAHECAVLRQFGAVPAIKARLAERYGLPGWRTVMPPLQPLGDDDALRLATALAAHATHHASASADSART